MSESATIIKHTSTNVKGEADIYNQVKWVLQFSFPGVRNKNKSRFISSFKTYNPDILIPDKHVAIEYKYVRDENEIENYIDQIKIDSASYIDDPDYKIFYAVLYIINYGKFTNDSIHYAWDKKIFPTNWKLIIVKAN